MDGKYRSDRWGNMKFSEINDPNGICKDITGLGRWGNGDVEMFMEH